MSVASQNPFALLDDDAKPAAAPAVKPSVPANPTSAAPRAGASVAPPTNTRSSVPGSGGRTNNRGTGSYPRGGARGGNRSGAAPAAGEEEALPARQREPRGDRGDRGGRGRGRGRGGRGRPFDRHSQTGKEDTEKRVAQGWGGDDPKRELDAEDKAVADADAEKNGEAPVANGDAAPAAEGEAAAAPAAGATPTIPEEEVDNTKTLDQYLAEQTAKRAQLGGGPKEVRAAGDDQWSGFGTQLVKDTEGEAFFYKAKEDKASSNAKSSGKKEKQFLEIDATFAPPAGAREGGRGGRGRGEGRGGYRGRGEGSRGGARGGRGRGDGARRGGASNAGVNLSDQSAFPSLS